MSRPLTTVVSFVAATAVATWVGYLNIFSFFAPYDDEGFFLVALRWFHQRGICPPFYGPLHFAILDAIFSALRLPITHDNGRLVALAIWVLASLAAGLLAFAFSRMALVGAAVQLLVFHALLSSMMYEGSLHPAALTTFLLAGLAGTALFAPRNPRLCFALQGALVAALILIKVNVGVFAGLAVAIFCALSCPMLSRRRSIIGAVFVAFNVLPVLLMRAELHDSAAQRFALVVTCSAIAVTIALLTERNRGAFEARDLRWLIGGALAIFVAVFGVLALRGANIVEVMEATLIRPARFPTLFYSRVNLGSHDWQIALLSLVACIIVVVRGRSFGRLPDAFIRAAAGMLLLYSVSGVYRQLPLGFLFAPLSWIAVMKPNSVEDVAGLAAFRRLLPPLAVLQTLQAYPVAGSKVDLSSFLLVLVGALCLFDAWKELTASREMPRFAAAAFSSLILAFALGGMLRTMRFVDARYATGTPLPLPGSARIRVPPEQAAVLEWMTDQIRARCARFVTVPALYSFYVWTNQDPPTGVAGIAWQLLIPREEQARIVAEIEPVDRLCVVQRGGASLSEDAGALVAYIGRNFAATEGKAQYQLLERARR